MWLTIGGIGANLVARPGTATLSFDKSRNVFEFKRLGSSPRPMAVLL
jgi:hypothetical protein